MDSKLRARESAGRMLGIPLYQHLLLWVVWDNVFSSHQRRSFHSRGYRFRLSQQQISWIITFNNPLITQSHILAASRQRPAGNGSPRIFGVKINWKRQQNTIPSFGVDSVPSLEILRLNDNYFLGSIPASIATIPHLLTLVFPPPPFPLFSQITSLTSNILMIGFIDKSTIGQHPFRLVQYAVPTVSCSGRQFSDGITSQSHQHHITTPETCIESQQLVWGYSHSCRKPKVNSIPSPFQQFLLL